MHTKQKNTTTNIRTFKTDDLEAIAKLDQQAFHIDCYPSFFFRQAFDVFGELFKVAENSENKIVGYILGALQPNHTDAWILSVIVDENCRRQRIAEQLINSVLDIFQHQQVTQVLLTVDPPNVGAQTLYQKLGFVEFYRDANYFGNHEERIVMKKTLKNQAT
jgi:ribosomal protein S18 acetylase RimI-like enzyme